MSKSELPYFSIIVPVYNTENYLEQCIDSIVGQTFKRFEVILVDDGSSDRSASICDEYAKKYGNVEVIHKENGGLVSARETGLLTARGMYIGYVDSDDWIDRNLLQDAYEIIQKYHADILSYNVLLEYSDRAEKQKNTVEAGFYDKDNLKKCIYPIMLYNPEENFYNFGVYPSISNKLIKSEIIKKNHCTDYSITMGEDAACTYACFLDADSYYSMEGYYYHYRQNSASMTNQYDASKFDKYKTLLNYMEKRLSGKTENMDMQLRAHKAFRVKHAVLNESKAPVRFGEKVRTLRKKMTEYGFDSAFTEMGKVKAGAASKVFIFCVKYKHYAAALTICEVFKKLHRF